MYEYPNRKGRVKSSVTAGGSQPEPLPLPPQARDGRKTQSEPEGAIQSLSSFEETSSHFASPIAHYRRVPMKPLLLLLLSALASIPAPASLATPDPEPGGFPEWKLVTKQNFSSQIRHHPHILLLVTLPCKFPVTGHRLRAYHWRAESLVRPSSSVSGVRFEPHMALSALAYFVIDAFYVGESNDASLIAGFSQYPFLVEFFSSLVSRVRRYWCSASFVPGWLFRFKSVQVSFR